MSHEAVQSTFNNAFIHRRKVYPRHFNSYLSELLGIRNTADYKARLSSKRAASQQLKKARDFVESMEQEIGHD